MRKILAPAGRIKKSAKASESSIRRWRLWLSSQKAIDKCQIKLYINVIC